MQTQIIIFVIATVLIAWVSRRSLRNRNSHGFYRFFGWEAILALGILNYKFWFQNPFGLTQIISWLLLAGSALIGLFSIVRFIQSGKIDSSRDDDIIFGFEKTTQLVTTGLYRYIRHPMYGSLILLAWGIFLKEISVITIIITAIATIFLILTMLNEERENIEYFGADYIEYMKRSKMFIPFIF